MSGRDRDRAQERRGGLVEPAQTIVGDTEREFELRAVLEALRGRR